MSLHYLGLTSLKSIGNGNVGLAWNNNLCYLAGLNLAPVFTIPTQLMKQKFNGDPKECGKYEANGAGPKITFNAFLSGFRVLF